MTEIEVYPEKWREIADRIKEQAGWKCERCGIPHGSCPAVLTVHHLNGVKAQCEDWNLAALCQVCHLHIQGKVKFHQDYFLPHTPWMRRHVEAYNLWAEKNNEPKLTVA